MWLCSRSQVETREASYLNTAALELGDAAVASEVEIRFFLFALDVSQSNKRGARLVREREVREPSDVLLFVSFLVCRGVKLHRTEERSGGGRLYSSRRIIPFLTFCLFMLRAP